MTHKHAEPDDDAKVETPPAALTVDAVQRLIDASLVRFEMTHGHLSAADGAKALKALAGHST